MSTIQTSKVPQFLDEVALLKIIDTIQSLLNLFQQQINNDMKILILVGVTGSGKSTIFNLLGGAKFKLIESEDGVEELELEDISSEFSVMKGGMQSVTKEPNYYFNEEYNHLLIDFPGFQDTNGELDQIMIQMLFYKISTQSKVKILYVVRHPELDFQERGSNLQEFIRTTFTEQSIGIESISILLNAFNEENYSDEEVIASAREQINQQYNTDCNSLNVIVLRKINEQDDIVKQFSEEKRRKIWEDIIKSEEITIQPIQILHTEKISSYLSRKSFQYIEGVCSSIQTNLTKTLQNTQIKDISILKKLSSKFKELPKIKKIDFVQWFERFAIVSANLAQQLGCLEIVKQKSQEFLKIYLFFSQFSNFINGYYECFKNGDFASTQYHDMILIINNKIEFLKEKQKVEQTTAEKNKEIQLKNIAMSRAEQERNQKKKYQLQQRQLKSETDILQQQIFQQRNQKKKLENETTQIRNDYNWLKQQSESTQRQLDYKIQQEKKTQQETQMKLNKKKKELNELKNEQFRQLNAIEYELEKQNKRKSEIQCQISQVNKEISQYKANLGKYQTQNSYLRSQTDQQRQTNNQLQQQLKIEKTNYNNDDGCQLI